MPKCTSNEVSFGRLGRREIRANFDGGDISTEGGVLLLRGVDCKIGLTKAVAKVLSDGRDPARIKHDLRDMGVFQVSQDRDDTESGPLRQS